MIEFPAPLFHSRTRVYSFRAFSRLYLAFARHLAVCAACLPTMGDSKAAVRRALATALELSAKCNEDGYGTTRVTLPNGWCVAATSPHNFELQLPDGSKCETAEAIRQQLRTLDEVPCMEETGRKSGRKRTRPLDFWRGERVVYDHGEVIGVIVNN